MGWTEKGANDQGAQRRCLTIRPTVTFGPNNFANMYSLIRQIHSGKYAQFGKASNIKSLSYVENIVDATLHLWDYDGRANYDPYNWIDKPDLTSAEIAITSDESLGKGSNPLTVPLWLGLLAGVPFDVVIKLTGKNLPISTARIKKLFCMQTKYEADKVLATGYTPKVPLKEGIDRMVKWYLAEGKDRERGLAHPAGDRDVTRSRTDPARDRHGRAFLTSRFAISRPSRIVDPSHEGNPMRAHHRASALALIACAGIGLGQTIQVRQIGEPDPTTSVSVKGVTPPRRRPRGYPTPACSSIEPARHSSSPPARGG
jgi:hypothetical protein